MKYKVIEFYITHHLTKQRHAIQWNFFFFFAICRKFLGILKKDLSVTLLPMGSYQNLSISVAYHLFFSIKFAFSMMFSASRDFFRAGFTLFIFYLHFPPINAE